jgi:hypothetical protein
VTRSWPASWWGASARRRYCATDPLDGYSGHSRARATPRAPTGPFDRWSEFPLAGFEAQNTCRWDQPASGVPARSSLPPRPVCAAGGSCRELV